MSPEARLLCGFSIVLVPTIVYGGLTVLGVISGGRYGAPAPTGLTELQTTFYRAGHAHAGVLMLLSLFLQLFLDYVVLPASLIWPTRISAVVAALLVSGGFFAVAHVPALRGILYIGAILLALTTLTVGVGLLRSL